MRLGSSPSVCFLIRNETKLLFADTKMRFWFTFLDLPAPAFQIICLGGEESLVPLAEFDFVFSENKEVWIGIKKFKKE